MYVAVAIAVMFIHRQALPGMFEEIFRSAFDWEAIFGGFTGSCLMMGIRRGLFSNEAGVGSAPNAAAAADVSHPVKQGLVQMLSVFIDTLLLCTATAFMLLSTGLDGSGYDSFSAYVQDSMRLNFGPAGPVFVTLSLFLFAFTTLIGNFFYIDNCVAFLLGRMPGERAMAAIRTGVAAAIFLGSGLSAKLAWNLTDLFLGLMCLIHIPVLLRLGGTAMEILRDYEAQRRGGDEPVFRPDKSGLKGVKGWVDAD